MEKQGIESRSTVSSQGFTLLETCFAMFILALLALNTVATLATCMRIDNSNREREQAHLAARNQMETILAWPDYGTLKTKFNDTWFTAGTLLAPPYATGGSGDANASPGRVTVDDTNPDLLRVTVRVDWTISEGADSLELSTLIANPQATVKP